MRILAAPQIRQSSNDAGWTDEVLWLSTIGVFARVWQITIGEFVRITTLCATENWVLEILMRYDIRRAKNHQKVRR